MADFSLTWPGAVFACLVVVSLYFGGCQAALGDSCSGGSESSNCTATGEICSNNVCACDPVTHYANGAVCVTKVAAGLSCDGLPNDACSTNSGCVDNICTCNQGFYDSDGGGSSGTCVPQVAAGNSCTGLPADACSTNSTCVNNTICTCNQGFYDSDGGGSSGTCVPQIALSGTCVNSLGVAQCVTSGAVCETDNTCRCSAGSFDDNGFNTAGGVCQDMSLLVVTGVTTTNLGTSSVTISWTAPATYSGQVNRYEVTWTSTQGSGTQSASTATFLDVTGLQSATQYSFTVKTFEYGSRTSEQEVSSSPALVVTTKSQLGDTCGTCADANSFCSTTCDCKDGYYDDNGNGVGGTCKQKIALSGSCNSGLVGVSQCSDVNAECTSTGGNLCRCKAGYYDDNGFSPAGGTCTDMSTLKVLSVTVTEGTDTVTVTWTPPTDASQVNRYQVIWSPDKTDGSSSFDAGTASQATISGFTSGTTYDFNVKTVESGSRTSQEIESDFSKTVSMKAALSVACGTGSPVVVCADTTTASCTSNVCRCNENYFDSNGYGTSGGVCTLMSTLKVLSVTVTEGTDSAIVTWTPPTDASQVNSYQVIWSPAKVDGSFSFDAGAALTATISGFTSGATYTFNVKTLESGSRMTSQEIESDFPKIVSMKAALSVVCGTSSPVVVCEDTAASCILSNNPPTNVCRCNENYFDSNGYGTSGGVCTPMTDLKVTAVTSSSVTTTGVTISWTAPTDSSQVSGYTVVWRLSGGTAVVGSSSVGNSLTTAVITGLTQRTTYVFNVKSLETGSRSTIQEVESDSSVTITTKAELSQTCDGTILCGDGLSECIAGDTGGNVCRCQSGYYDSNGYGTPGGVCTDMNGLIVTSLTVGVEGTSTVTIEWLVPSTGSDQVNRYEVHWTPALSNGTGNYNAEKATSVKLTGFVSGQQYTFYVKSIETGSRATPQEVQTNGILITINAGLNINCGGSILCADSNAECTLADDETNNICRCKSTYFDSNGYSNSGGMCIAMSTLAVTGLTLAKEGTDTVNVSWTPPSQYTDQVSRYEVHWSPSATINGNTIYNALLTTAVQLVGFVPGQTYTFTVYSVESGSRSQEQIAVTSSSPLTMKPSTPSGFTETDVDGPQITLSWSLPSGMKTSYDVTTTPALSPTTTFTESITFSTNVLNGHQYNISITTVSGSERSDPLLATFRTVSKTPNPPTGLDCTVTTDKTVTLTWTAPVYPNGDIQHYVVNSITTTAMFSTSTSQTEYTVDGLQPETMYRFSVATVNDAAVTETNQSQYSSEKDCQTKAAMSLEPNTLVVSQEQSRQFTLNWTKPTVTNGDLWGYRLKVLDGSTCVQEVLFTCNSCTGYMAFSYTCPEGVKQTQTILPTDLDSFTYTVENLLPYINYTVSVVAVNAAGDGHPNTQYAMTDQEVPQNPTTLTATVASSTEIDVTWDISDPRPGPTTFTLYIIAEAPETSRTKVIQGFSVRTYKVVGLEEYRTYTFNLTASTVKGSAVYQQTLPSAKTLAADPGAVGSFVVDRPDGPNYTTVRVSWQLPAILDRNSDITKFMFSHNTTGGNLNAAPEEIPTVDSVTRNLAVLPQNTYYIEVYAIGTNPNGEIFNGVKSTETYLAPAGSPPLDVGETVIPTSSNNNIQATQTSFTLTLTDDFFKNSLYGSIEDYSLVLCKDSCKTLGDQSEAVSHDYLARLDGWKDARANGYTDEYRAMSKADFITYLNQASTSGRRRKRATNSFVVNIGTATDCATSTETYCNGPLEAGSIYFVKAVVCTVGGCTLSTLYGPYSTEKVPDPGTDVGVIVGVVCGIVAFALVIVLLVFIVKRRQSSKPTTQLSDIDVDGFREIDKKQINDKRPVVMERFPQHVADLHKDSKLKFAKEYEDLKELSPRHPCNAANEDGNKMKNRYVNILPFDHSRVKLNPSDPEDPSTDFINANYIPGYNSQREYIASQGPIPGTIDDFWRMIWEQQVAICVMLTLCKEDGRIKCEQYWPTERNEPKQYGDIVVEITSYSTVNTYDFRIFKLTQGDQTRTLKHFHFLNWKDFSANVQNDVMIDFIQNVRAHIQPPDKKGPMLIHCSAGVGRTGTYISLDQLIQFIDEHDFSEELDIFDLVLSMRNYRVFMVQTEQQYVFIHDCAKDLIERKRERLQENDGESDENIYINKAYEQDAEENIYQNENFHQTAKTEL